MSLLVGNAQSQEMHQMQNQFAHETICVGSAFRGSRTAIWLLLSVLCGCGGTSSAPEPRRLLSVAVQPNSATAVKNRAGAFSVTGAFNQAPTTETKLNAAGT